MPRLMYSTYPVRTFHITQLSLVPPQFCPLHPPPLSTHTYRGQKLYRLLLLKPINETPGGAKNLISMGFEPIIS